MDVESAWMSDVGLRIANCELEDGMLESKKKSSQRDDMKKPRPAINHIRLQSSISDIGCVPSSFDESPHGNLAYHVVRVDES
jgi:hypothetical protein